MLKLLVNFFFVTVFFIQSSSWAYAGVDTKIPDHFIKKMAQYNKMSQKEKASFFISKGKAHPEMGEKFFSDRLDAFGGHQLPNINVDKNEINFTIEGKTYTMTIVDEMKISFMGQVLDVTPGKFTQSMQEFDAFLEKKFAAQKTSFIDFIISSAHAGTGETVAAFILGFLGVVAAACSAEIWGPLLLIGGIAIVGGIALGVDSYTASKIQEICESLSEKLSQQNLVGKGAVDEMLRKVRHARRVLESEYCYGSKGSRCETSRNCLSSMEKELSFDHGSVNDTSRGSVKDQGQSRVPARGGSEATGR